MIRLYLSALLIALAQTFAGSGPAAAEEAPVTVATPAALEAALAEAGDGATILLAPGDYGNLRIARRSFSPPLTLRAADPDRRPVVTGLDIRDSAGLVLDGLVFDYTYAPDHTNRLRSFSIGSSERITIRNSAFDGDLARGRGPAEDGFGFAIGLSVRNAREVLIEDNAFFDFFRAASFRNIAGLTIRGNDIHSIRMDGLNFAQVDNVLIEGNTIRDFNRALGTKDHADMIQFWTAYTSRPSTGITIRGNVLNTGVGAFTQSIFIRNEKVDRGDWGHDMYYRDITIEENVIINAHLHGITVAQTDGVVIRRNTVVHNPRSAGEQPRRPRWIPQIRVRKVSRDVRIEDNIVATINGHEGQPDWVVEGNLMIQHQHPTRPGHFDRIFANALRGDPRDLGSYAYRPDGPAGPPGLGAEILRARDAGN